MHLDKVYKCYDYFTSYFIIPGKITTNTDYSCKEKAADWQSTDYFIVLFIHNTNYHLQTP